MLSGGGFPYVTQLTSLYTEMKNISNGAKEIILAYQGSLGEGREGEMVARFPACPHMTVLRPGLAGAATLCACHSCPSTADEAVSRTMTLF